jgi:hypothetical protein
MRAHLTAAAMTALILSSTAHAENLAYQFVCTDGSADIRSGWLDERVSNRTMFEKPRSGEKYFYCKSDCHPHYGINRCHFTIPAEQGHWDAWTEHRAGLSCDKICLNVRAVDGRLNPYISSSNVDITRYQVAYDASTILSWTARSHTGANNYPTTRATHYNASGQRDGYTFCWDGDDWGTDFWSALYGAPGTSGRMTEVVLRDSSGRGHVFRVVGYYDVDETW